MLGLSLFKTYELAVDFGSSNIKASIKDKGVVFNEPSVIAINKKTKKVVAVGLKAKKIIGRENSDIIVIRPVEKGRIVDHKAAALLVNHIISTYCNSTLLKPVTTVSVPNNLTEMERKAYIHDFSQAGSKNVHLIPAPISTGIGNGLNVTNPSGRLIVNFGGGICEISIVSLGTVIVYSHLDIGSIDFDRRIVDYVKDTHKLLIGENTAEKIKIAIGTAIKKEDDEFFAVKGKDLVSGLPSVARISANELVHIFYDDVKKIAEEIAVTIKNAPCELSADIENYGIIISGQASLLNGFKEIIDDITGIKSYMSQDLSLSCINGAQKACQQRKTLIKSGIM